jgi:formylglycine-generating enzyme required for sulfatase activity
MEVIEPEMVQVPAGTLAMGVPASEDEFPENLRPWHTGKVLEMPAFSISKYAITNREYRDYVEKAGADVPMKFDDPEFNADNQPVVGISWLDGTAYCKWMQEATGKAYHLPTDAQYEYAARGGSEGTRYPWGDELDPSKSSYGGLSAPEPVDKYPPNGYGVHDMVGGVWEWCQEVFEDVSEGVRAKGGLRRLDPAQVAQNPVLRGSSYVNSDPLSLHIAYRHEDPRDLRHPIVGLRVAI